jgi:menaquinone-dependent protoporphyrinogen oxidase
MRLEEFGEEAVVQAVLVTYASKHGSTKEVAEAIGATLRSLGSKVDVVAAGGVEDLAGYDAVVVGSAVYHDRWQEEARNLLNRVRPRLFSSGPTGGTPDADAKVAAAASEASSVPPNGIEHEARRIGASGHITFPGKVSEEATGFLERWMPRGDWRDFHQITAWAKSIHTQLTDG